MQGKKPTRLGWSPCAGGARDQREEVCKGDLREGMVGVELPLCSHETIGKIHVSTHFPGGISPQLCPLTAFSQKVPGGDSGESLGGPVTLG